MSTFFSKKIIPKANIIQQSAVTSCPVPAPIPAKLSDQGQGILFVEVQTLGFGKQSEIIEIAVIDINENVLFHSLVKPSKPIYPLNHTHTSIKDTQIKKAPSFAEIWKPLSDAIGRADIAFYNADYCKRMIMQSVAKAYDSDPIKYFYTIFPNNRTLCVGELYELYNSKHPSDGHWSNGRQHINSACVHRGLVWRDVPQKRAIGDAIKSARLYKYLDAKAVVA